MITENGLSVMNLPQQAVVDPRSSSLAPRSSVLPYPRLLPSLASAGLLWSCYFPLAWGWLAWVALVPLLCLVRSETRPRRIYLCAWMAGLAFFWPVLQWLRVGDYNMMYFSWAALATYCACFFPLAIFLIRLLDRRLRLPLILSLPVAWTALEFLRAHFLTGFPWYFLAHSQHDFLPLIQIADLGGAYTVSFLVAAVNAFVFEVLYSRRRFRTLFALPEERRPTPWWSLPLQGLAVIVLLVAAVSYGDWRLKQDQFDSGPRVALIQGNLDQEIRNSASSPKDKDEALGKMIAHYRNLCDRAADFRPRPDLIVWPETSAPGEWEEYPSGVPKAESLKLARWVARAWETNVLLGLNSTVTGADRREKFYNSAVFISSEGLPAGRYDKIHLVPFGEYVPFKHWLPWMKAFAPYDFEYGVESGEQATRFRLRAYRFGVVICFEDTDPDSARQYVRKEGEIVDFLVNTSNDGWWKGTSGHDEHLAISRFRAIETRRAVCRSVNMGISAVIDANGRVLEPVTVGSAGEVKIWEVQAKNSVTELPISRWSEFKQVAGVLIAVVPIDHRMSFYAQWGDWLPWACWALLGAGFLWIVLRRGPRVATRGLGLDRESSHS
jgi:apolipoprotein N-acyltransferase